MLHEKNEQAVIQNLKDAGCDSEMIAAFVKDVQEQKTAEALKLLSIHRRSLLEKLHRGQKQIDCLDYLVYQIEKYKKERHDRNGRRLGYEKNYESGI